MIRKVVVLGVSFLSAAFVLLAILAPACAKDSPRVEKSSFGEMEDGTVIGVYTLTNSNGVRVRIMTLGATLMTVETPDRDGIVDDITLHRESLEDYLKGHPLLGSVVGRYANRIGGAKFTIDGVEYPLAQNHGEHHIHGGGKDAAFHWKVWDAEPPFDATNASEPFLTKGVIKAIQGDDFAGVALTLISPDGAAGFPGELHARVVYELNNENELTLRYSATTTKPTHVNLTNHAYWNLDGIELIDADAALDGHAALNDRSTRHGDVGIKIDASGHYVWIDADQYLDVDEKLIPSGRLIDVENTPFDFNRLRTIGERVEQLDPPKYDHCYVFGENEGDALRLVATAVGPNSGRTLQVYTTEPGVQFYTGNPNGFCFETQHYPNAPNISSFPSTLLRPGETFESTTIFKFGIENPEDAAVRSIQHESLFDVIKASEPFLTKGPIKTSLLPPNGPVGRPLPLVGHWNMGGQGQGWTPELQLELLREGRRLLPWMKWPQGDPNRDEESRQRFDDYYVDILAYCRENRLPISFRGTQWEAMLLGLEYRELPEEECPAVIGLDGEIVRKLSPFGPISPWRDPASTYVDTPAMRLIQESYPDPPLVLFVSNNEAPDLRWHQAESLSKRYLDLYGEGRSDEFKRDVVARGWMERYPVMFDAMRKSLTESAWRENVRFIGYGAFGPSHFGRWSGWKDYSLITDQWTSPNWLIWDGGSPSYYTHNWAPNRDHWVWSTQIQSMNWLFQLEEAWAANPDFWWEISLWDGNQGAWMPGVPYSEEMTSNSKACQYMEDGQTYTPARFAGWAQFGMWLLRPRVVREFRGSTVPLDPWRPFFEELLDAVDRVHENPVLAEFWRHGELVSNLAHEHPYQTNVPEKYQEIPRWYLLDTDLDPPRPWTYETNLSVFSMALVLGEPGRREWLIYAHSPLEDRQGVSISLPELGTFVVDVPRGGIFVRVSESSDDVEYLSCRSAATGVGSSGFSAPLISSKSD